MTAIAGSSNTVQFGCRVNQINYAFTAEAMAIGYNARRFILFNETGHYTYGYLVSTNCSLIGEYQISNDNAMGV